MEKRRYFSNLRFFPYSCSRLSNEMDKKRYIPIPESQKSEYKRQPPMAAWLAHLNDNVKKFKPSPITGKLGKFLKSSQRLNVEVVQKCGSKFLEEF